MRTIPSQIRCRLHALPLVALLVAPALALDDLPVFLDAGCDPGKTTGGLNNGFAQGPAGMVLADKPSGRPSDGKTVPVTCVDRASGSDAIVVNLPRRLENSDSWTLGIKFADDRAHSLRAYKDVHVWIRNKAATVAKFRMGWEAVAGAAPPMKTLEIPGGGGWKEYVVPLSEMPGDSAYGLQLKHPIAGQWNGADVDADPIDILVDSIVLTDGSGTGAIRVPTAIHRPVPANWGSNFLVGSFDNRSLGASTEVDQGGLAYRYQYVMPGTPNEYSRSGKGYLYDYAVKSESLGVKTAIVWYNLGKNGEGWAKVTANLASGTYMTGYFDRYEWALDQLAMAGQEDYMIVCEPDMYGFLMRGPDGATGTPVTDPTRIAVDMSRANALSGKTWEPDMVGWARYMVARARQKLPKGVIIGHMPNHWGVSIPGQVGQGRKESHYISALAIGTFLDAFGPEGLGDVVFVEKTDHDAGHKPSEEDWLWDSTNYAKYFLWTRTIAWKTGLPICGWQVSEGNMANASKWRDDAVQTFMDHPDWWIDGGFAGILFGAGNADCVNYEVDKDGGWFLAQMQSYSANPVALPRPAAAGRRSSQAQGLGWRATAEGIAFDGWEGAARLIVRDAAGRQLFAGTIEPGRAVRLQRAGMAFASLETPSGRLVAAIPPVR